MSNASRLFRAGTYLLGPLAVAITLEPLDIPTRIATILYLDDSLSLSFSLSCRAFNLPFPFLLPVFLSPSFSPSFFILSSTFLKSSPINIYALVAFPTDFLIRQRQSLGRENPQSERDRSNRYGHDMRSPDKRKSTSNNRVRCGGTQFHEQ